MAAPVDCNGLADACQNCALDEPMVSRVAVRTPWHPYAGYRRYDAPAVLDRGRIGQRRCQSTSDTGSRRLPRQCETPRRRTTYGARRRRASSMVRACPAWRSPIQSQCGTFDAHDWDLLMMSHAGFHQRYGALQFDDSSLCGSGRVDRVLQFGRQSCDGGCRRNAIAASA